jgi:hypothetical protein
MCTDKEIMLLRNKHTKQFFGENNKLIKKIIY